MVKPSKFGKGKKPKQSVASSSSNRFQGKSNGKQGKQSSARKEENDSDDEDHNFLAFNRKGKHDSDDEESEEEIFNINTKKSSGKKGAKEDSDEDNEEDSDSEENDDDDDIDDDDYDEDEYDRLNQLVHNLPNELKRDILHGKKSQDDDDEDDEEEEDDLKANKWGKKKTYWTGDTADLEIGQEMEDAYAEEEAAKELQQQKLKRMKKKDFYDDLEEDDDEEDEEEEDDEVNKNADVLGNKLSKKNQKAAKAVPAKKSTTKDKIAKELEAIVVDGNNDVSDVQTEQLAKDISSFTKDQKLELLATHAPELVSIIKELRERVDELLHKIQPIKTFLNKVKEINIAVDDDLVDYVEMKQQLLLSYCLNVVFYLSMKTMGKSVRNHPVMKQMLKLRYAMEKIHSLDGKLKYQVDRLLKLAEDQTSVDEIKSGLLRPNLSSFLSNKDNDEEEDDDDDGDEMDVDEDDDSEGDHRRSKKNAKKGGKSRHDDEDDYDDEEEEEEVYRPPKLSSTHYPDEKTLEKQDRQLQKKRMKLKNSELMETLREEFGTTPEMVTSTGNSAVNTGELKKLEKEQAERIKFEEERFVRTTLTRKEKQEMKKRMRDANRIDHLDDIGDYEDLEEISKMMVPGSSNGAASSSAAKTSAMTSTKALEQAMKVFSGKAGKSNGKTSALDLLAQEFNPHDDEEDGRQAKRRRAPAPDEFNDDDDLDGGSGGNVFDDFIDKKKQFLAKKKEHYTAEARYGGIEESVQEGDKRAISYEIMKNRGLTAHKSKANRNPRVKKREAYEKAVKHRKGAVRDVIKGVEDNYGGEMSGIKANLSRSRKVKS